MGNYVTYNQNGSHRPVLSQKGLPSPNHYVSPGLAGESRFCIHGDRYVPVPFCVFRTLRKAQERNEKWTAARIACIVMKSY